MPGGRIAALVGRNGAGKSTLLHLAGGLLRPRTGEIQVLDVAPGTPEARARVALLTQDKPLYPRFTVADTLRMGRKLNFSWDQAAAERTVREGGIALAARVGELSPGQRTRVALALALGKRNLLLWLLLGFAWCYELTVLEFRVADHATTSPGEGRPSWAVCAAIVTLCLGLPALAGVGQLAGLQWRWLVTAGGLTYPFYLVHQSIGIPLAKGLIKAVPWLGPLPSMVVSVICMLGLAALVHTWVERRLGRLLRQRLTLDVHLRDLAAKPGLTSTR